VCDAVFVAFAAGAVHAASSAPPPPTHTHTHTRTHTHRTPPHTCRALHYAALKGNAEVVEYLLNRAAARGLSNRCECNRGLGCACVYHAGLPGAGTLHLCKRQMLTAGLPLPASRV
jgi:hypothetical protein